ncbi:MAG: single-stranded-DNA-specific exonuclease RecJ [Candidatus Obscuribacterales bacterium]|nr:single-stranded-DNA-specific exonuclease RecJ [Candidatus Obscuribacterales bacterium]
MLKKKVWKLPEIQDIPEELLEVAGGSEILARLLQRRGLSDAAKARAFLNPEFYEATSPMVFSDMAKAIVRISKAIDSKEKITVYGDYDVDGVTSTSLMLSTLKKLGANVDFYIPNRANEGYGLNLKAVSILASKHRSKLIITCDCGVSNFAEINLAKSLGVDTIIVDHHSMPEVLPPAVAILHPKHFAEDHPLYHLPGVGVAYKLAEALLEDNNLKEEVVKLHDFVTLGMIADMVPLVLENRYLVQIGLPALVNSERAGIRALLDNTVKMDGTDIVGFGLAPRINAVGRLADASLAVNLMCTESESEALELAHQLELENIRRQELCEQIFFEADQKAKAALASGEDGALALYSAGWHHGVVGIVASRLLEKYHFPVFVDELDEEEVKIKGSARGVAGVDLYQILKANEHLLTKWGGHQMAAGFSADAANAEILCRALVETCNKALSGRSKKPVIEIDLELDSDLVDLSLSKLLKKLGPFGMANKKPVLMMQELEVLSTRPLGKEGKHHRLILRSKDQVNQFECVFWRSAGRVPAEGEKIDLAFNPEQNNFNGSERLQLVLCDWRAAGEVEAEDEPEQTDFSPEADTTKEVKVLRLETEYNGETASTSIARASTAVPEQNPELDEDLIALAADELLPEAQKATLPKAAELPPLPQKKDSQNPKTAIQINWKDLREHSAGSVVDAAVRKLGPQIQIFAEASKLAGHDLLDRSSISKSSHLLIWQYPPSLQVFRSIINKTQANQIYLCGAAESENYTASTFLKRLLAMVRFAVNQRDGQANAEKLCAGLASTKMALALGLTLLKKSAHIDWYAEDSTIFLELLDGANDGFEEHAEYRQLSNTLKEVTEFRNWCAEASLDEIQSELLPNAIRLGYEKSEPAQEISQNHTFQRVNQNDRASHI